MTDKTMHCLRLCIAQESLDLNIMRARLNKALELLYKTWRRLVTPMPYVNLTLSFDVAVQGHRNNLGVSNCLGAMGGPLRSLRQTEKYKVTVRNGWLKHPC